MPSTPTPALNQTPGSRESGCRNPWFFFLFSLGELRARWLLGANELSLFSVHSWGLLQSPRIPHAILWYGCERRTHVLEWGTLDSRVV